MADYTLEKLIQEAGIYYPRSYDITYRIGYVLQSIGAIGFAILYALHSGLQIIPFLIFESGIALSSLFLLVWKREIKKFILWMTFIGLTAQAISIFISAPFSEKIFFTGFGLTLVGGAGLVGKEAYCFRFNEGWLLLMIYPLAVIPNLFSIADFKYNLVISMIIAILQLSFLRKKISQPLLKSCEGNVCGLPKTEK